MLVALLTDFSGCLRQSLVVGVVAPPILVGSICNHLATDKDLQIKLREDETLIPAALEEFIRLYSPYRGFARTTSRDVEIHGETVRPREPITLCYTAANHDPEVFDQPDEFILERPNITKHLGFGRGRHQCAGMPLARLYVICQDVSRMLPRADRSIGLSTSWFDRF